MTADKKSGLIVPVLGVAFAAWLSLATPSAQAEDAVSNGWINSSQPIGCFNERRPDGRIVTVTVNNGVNPRKGIHGVIFHCDLQGFTPKHIAIPASELREYDYRAHLTEARTYLRFSWGDLLDLPSKVTGWIKRATQFVQDLTGLVSSAKEFLTAVLTLMSELGLDISQNMNNASGSAPVVRLATNVKSAAFDGSLPSLDMKVAWSYQATLSAYGSAARGKLASAIHSGIVEQQ